MFKEKTVFILGAGASCHYGYPTGEALVELIKNKCEDLNRAIEAFVAGINHQRDTILLNYAVGLSEIPLFFHHNDPDFDGRSFVKIFSNKHEILLKKLNQIDPPVIDHFLTHNKDLQDITKFLITWILLEVERNSVVDGNWIRFIYQKMMDDCENPQDFFENNNVHFVTFNYDVSLETRLYESVRHTQFFDGFDDVERFFNDKRFIHVYGKIRHENCGYEPLDIENDQSQGRVQFRGKNLLDKAYDYSKGIKTMAPYEKVENQAEIKQAKTVIEDAKNVFILGYGFDRMNSDNLDLPELLSRKPEGHKTPKNVYFTNYDNHNIVSKRAGAVFDLKNTSVLFSGAQIVEPEEIPDPRRYYEMSTKKVYEALSEDFELP